MTDLAGAPQAVPLTEYAGVPSPDGRLLARTIHDGVEVRMSDGQLLRVVRERGLTRTQFNGLAWEDGRHLLGTLTWGRRQCVVRIDVERAALSRATDWRRSSTTGYAFMPRR